MSWGYRIIIVYAVFIMAMLAMVYVASKQTNEMQSDHYYEEELKYQEVINGKNNLAALSDKLLVSEDADSIRIQLPTSGAHHISDGKLYFLRPSAQKYDVHFALSVNENLVQVLPKNKFLKGVYSIRLSWRDNQKLYFSEQSITIH